jgi:hypothetical protein
LGGDEANQGVNRVSPARDSVRRLFLAGPSLPDIQFASVVKTDITKQMATFVANLIVKRWRLLPAEKSLPLTLVAAAAINLSTVHVV